MNSTRASNRESTPARKHFSLMCEFALWRHAEIHALDNRQFRVLTVACLQRDRAVRGSHPTDPPWQLLREAKGVNPGVSGAPGTRGYWSVRKWRGRGTPGPVRLLASSGMLEIDDLPEDDTPDSLAFTLGKRLDRLIQESRGETPTTRKRSTTQRNRSGEWMLWKSPQVYALDDAAFRVLRYATLERDRVGEPFALRMRQVCDHWHRSMWSGRGAAGAWVRVVEAGFLNPVERSRDGTLKFRLSEAWQSGARGCVTTPAAIATPRPAARPSPRATEIERGTAAGTPAAIGEILQKMNLATP